MITLRNQKSRNAGTPCICDLWYEIIEKLKVSFITVHKSAETIQGRKLFAEIWYLYYMNLSIFLSHRLDFEAATVFQQPTAGSCDGDTITVTQTSTTFGNGFTNLCGTLTGQHSNNFNINF